MSRLTYPSPDLPLVKRINCLLVIAILCLAIPGAWRTAYAFRSVPEQKDFATYYLAAAMLNAGDSRIYETDPLYDIAIEKNVRDFAPPYVYPPLFASILRPIANLPYNSAKGVWFTVNVLLLVFSCLFLIQIAGYQVNAKSMMVSIGAIFLFPPVHQALVLGQVSPLLLFLTSGCLKYTIQREPHHTTKDLLAGTFLALIAFS